MSVYSGEFEVHGEVFNLYADRLIIRNGVIAFTLSGSDDDGEFKVEGNANLTSSGKYISNVLKVYYTSFGKEDKATIQFDVIKPTMKKLRCKVEGKWTQDIQNSWLFSGNLRPYKSK